MPAKPTKTTPTTKRSTAKKATDGAPALLHLHDENWGEMVRRAYNRGRAIYGYNYREIAARVSQLYPVADATIIRLNDLEDIPKQRRSRLLAYLVILAYGFEPESLGLTRENAEVDPEFDKRARDLLIPKNVWFPNHAA